MSKRGYPRLCIEDFGVHLLDSGDLDPVYIALNGHDKVGWPVDQRYRFLVAYWCLYHCGAAAYLSAFEHNAFWDQLTLAAANEHPTPQGSRWPRGHERRHWRGQQALNSVHDLRKKYPCPQDMVNSLMTRGFEYVHVAGFAQTHTGFGPWIAFKICDMLDRCTDFHVNFDQAAVFMFKDPVEAALRLWRVKLSLPDTAVPKNRAGAITEVVEYLTRQFREWDAPPLGDRPIGLQEVETILCKWKSHMNGHYPINNDIDEIKAGLAPWVGHSQAAAEFLAAMPS